MSVILALETTSDVCSVALGTVDEYVLDSRVAPRQHNKLVLPMIDAACGSLGIKPQAIDCVAFSAGPGSFTGVRIGAAVAQGIATGTNAQIYCVPTSLAMGVRICRTTRAVGEFVVRRTSRRDLVYEAHVRHEGGWCVFLVKDRLVKNDPIDDELRVFTDESVSLSAEDVLVIAAQDEANWQAPLNALPIYVEGDHPWRPAT